MWLGGRCSGNASGAVLRFFSDKVPQPEAVERERNETKAPEDESGEAPDVEKEVAVTLENDGTFRNTSTKQRASSTVATPGTPDGGRR